MDSLAHGFQITLADIRQLNGEVVDISPIVPFAEMSLIIERGSFQIPIFRGYVDSRTRTYSGSSTSLTVSGRSKTADLVDCSAIYKTNTFTNIDFTDMAQKLCEPFGVKVVSYLDSNEKISKYTIKNGATVFSVLEENARKVGATLTTSLSGELVLSYSDSAPISDVDIAEGLNLKQLTEKWDTKKRFSEYIFKGQGIVSGGKPWEPNLSIGIKAIAKDNEVPRYRPLIKASNGKTTNSQLKKNAHWESQVRKGKSLEYQVSLQGWFQGDSGQPWEINTLTNLISQRFDINKSLLITDVEFTKSDSGTETAITLRDPKTYEELQ